MSSIDGVTTSLADTARTYLTRRNLVSAGIAVAVICSAFLAITKGSETAGAPVVTQSSTALAVATSDLVEQTVADQTARRATGGYVPGVGMVITAEIPLLNVSEIESWTTDVLIQSGTTSQDLPAGEQIVFLLDIAAPTRLSRLISLDPSEIDDAGQMVRRDAPAVSTAPLVPIFEAGPGE